VSDSDDAADPPTPTDPDPVPTALDEFDAFDAFDAVVYDLDGTLVNLVVDWADVEREAAAVLDERDVVADGSDVWAMLDAADAAGSDVRAALETVVAGHEREGARASERLPLADDPPRRSVPLGVCSLNAEEAVRIALDRHDLLDAMGAVVGRDTFPERKPHPRPLLECCRRLGVDPDACVFVGDSERDAVTAERAGVAFRYVDGSEG
jgi:phosphoglycolate phosphatase